MNRIFRTAALLGATAVLVFGCSGGTPTDLTTEVAAQAIKASHGDPSFIYLNFSGVKPDTELGKQLKKLMDTGVFVYEWGDVKRVFVAKDKEAAAAYAKGDIQIYLDGQLTGDLAVQKVFLDKVLKITGKKNEAVARYIERQEPSALYDAIMADAETKAVVEAARADKTISEPVEKDAHLVKEQGVWKAKD